MKVITVLSAIHNRPEITDMFLTRLVRAIGKADTLNRYVPVMVATHGQGATCWNHGVDHIETDNKPLGKKWNVLVDYAQKKYNPDYVMILGSDDFISGSYLEYVDHKINQGYDLINPTDIYYYSLNPKRVKYGECGHYKGKNRLLGVGRTISRKILDGIDWWLWDNDINNGMDRNLYNKIKDVEAYKMHSFTLKDTNTYIVDIKSVDNIGGIGSFELEYIDPTALLKNVMRDDEIDALMGFKEREDHEYIEKYER